MFRGLEAPVESTLWVMLVRIQGHIGTLSPKPQFFGSPGRFFFLNHFLNQFSSFLSNFQHK